MGFALWAGVPIPGLIPLCFPSPSDVGETAEMELAPEDISFFVREGYLILHDALDARLCEQALDL